MNPKSKIRHLVVGAAVMGFLTVPAYVTSVAQADDLVAATAEEHEAKARIYRDKAKTYREEASENRKAAEGYRNATNMKGRKLNSPAHKKVAADLDAMAKHDETLAKDADRIADFHERQVQILKAEAKSE